MNQRSKTTLLLSTKIEGFLKSLIIFFSFATTLSVQGQNIINPHNHLIEDLEHEYKELFNTGIETDNSANQLLDEGPFRNEINGTIWVRDSTHSFYRSQRDLWRSFILKRDSRGNPIHSLSIRSTNLSKKGPWSKYSQRFCKYDTKNNEVERYSQYWDRDNKKWVNGTKYNTEYDNASLFTLSISQKWNTTKSEWINSIKISRSIDEKGNNIRYQRFVWNDVTQKWNSFSNSEFVYSSSNKLLTENRYSWDIIKNQWFVLFKYEYIYNNSDLLISRVSISLDTTLSLYIKRHKLEYDYGSNDSIKLKTYYIWDTISNSWLAGLNEMFVYDLSNNLVEYSKTRWQRFTSQLLHSTINKYTYDINNYLTKYTSYYKDERIGPHDVYSVLNQYTNNDIGLKIHLLHQVQDTKTNKWTNSYQQFFHYDKNNQLIENIGVDWLEKDSTWILNRKDTKKYDRVGNELEDIIYDWNGTSWFISTSNTSFWSEFELTFNKEVEVYLNIFPNPVNDHLVIEMDDENKLNSVILFDQMGKVLITNYEDGIIEMSTLQPGNYFIHINTTYGSVTRKIVKH